MTAFRFRTLVVAAACVAAVFAVRVRAAEPVVTGVTVVGARTVSARQVVAWSGLEPGKPLSRDAVATGIRRLYATQKFSDLFVYAQPESGGVRLLVNLSEFPRVRQVVFKGNEKVKKEDLVEAFPPTVGQFANPAIIARDLGKIRELYYDRGYYNVVVATDTTRVDAAGLTDVTVQIVEGRKVKTRSIAFVGNQTVSADNLRGAMKQKTGGFLRSGAFKKKQFEEDRERIVSWYRDRGYLDAAITEVEQTLADDRENLDLIIHVTEGSLYRVGDINWSANKVFDDATIAERVTLQKGRLFSEGDYQRMLQGLHSLYYDSGHIYATIEPVRNVRGDTVDLSFTFREGEPARVRDIEVVDNSKTYDRVILRQLSIFPGDIFSNSKVGNSQRDIFGLGYFEDVQVEPQPTDDSGDIDLVFKVKEKQTGQFSFGMAYSAQTSVTGFIQVAENNFLGKGQNVSLAWQFGSRRRYVDLSFTEPWFRGTPTTLGADLFDRFQYNFDDFYESRVRGFALRLGRRIPGTRRSTVGLRYELSATRLANFSQSYISYLNNLESQIGTSELPFERLDRVDWPRRKSSLTLTLNRNSTDSPFFPTSGSRTNYSVELSGGPLGSDIDYQKHFLTHSYFQKLPGGLALNLRSMLGLIVGLDRANQVPDYEKFRLGGNRLYPLRGYRDLEVVPRGNPGFIGGRFFTILNTEVLYPLTKAVQVLAFLDQGDAWNSFGEADFTNLRKGAGFGLRVDVPMMGQIGFDYGYGFDRLGGPAWEPHFNFGTFF
jgi:outer membrane protein insertion porin family